MYLHKVKINKALLCLFPDTWVQSSCQLRATYSFGLAKTQPQHTISFLSARAGAHQLSTAQLTTLQLEARKTSSVSTSLNSTSNKRQRLLLPLTTPRPKDTRKWLSQCTTKPIWMCVLPPCSSNLWFLNSSIRFRGMRTTWLQRQIRWIPHQCLNSRKQRINNSNRHTSQVCPTIFASMKIVLIAARFNMLKEYARSTSSVVGLMSTIRLSTAMTPLIRNEKTLTLSRLQ